MQPTAPDRVSRGPLILASSSPRRLALLAQIGIVPDQVLAPAVDEAPHRDELPRQYAERIARAKAAYAWLHGAAAGPAKALVLTADTVVAVGRRILPKAATETEARGCLALLSGRRHRVITAVVLRHAGGQSERLVESVVAFSRLTELQIDALIAAGDWQGKAGGYAVHGHAAANIRFLSGSYSNVVGLPLFETAQLLRAHRVLA
ncbi:Maf family protein [Lichenicoccus sp.]|uniref:Maf family protein n=1 Tax=Lichenicoccus sp. TaxID=2781899 RepID=UPI003D14C397